MPVKNPELSRLVRRALKAEGGALPLEGNTEEFLRNHFERLPLLGSAQPGIELSWKEFFASVPALHKAETVRFLTPTATAMGLPREEVEKDLEELGGLTQEAFEQYFRSHSVTFAVQEGVQYWDSIRRPAESLAKLLGTPVSVTVMATPGRSAGTDLHYDSGDVFAVQLQGAKHWDVFEPQDVWPCIRTPAQDPDREAGALVLEGSYDLQRGDVLYVPRGWIHEVRNVGDEPSLHASFVAHANSWLSLFANLMDQGFDSLRDRLYWREAITRDDVEAQDGEVMLERFLDELGDEMRSRLARHGWANFDHVYNDSEQRRLRQQAQESLSHVEESNGVRIVPSGAHYLIRHSNTGDFVRVSSDGARFFDVPAPLFHRICSEDPLPLKQLEEEAFSEEDIINGLYVLVSETGAFRLEKAPQDP